MTLSPQSGSLLNPSLLSELWSTSPVLWSLVVVLLLLLVVPTGLRVLSSLLMLLLLFSFSRRRRFEQLSSVVDASCKLLHFIGWPVTAAMVSGTLDCSSSAVTSTCPWVRGWGWGGGSRSRRRSQT